MRQHFRFEDSFLIPHCIALDFSVSCCNHDSTTLFVSNIENYDSITKLSISRFSGTSTTLNDNDKYLLHPCGEQIQFKPWLPALIDQREILLQHGQKPGIHKPKLVYFKNRLMLTLSIDEWIIYDLIAKEWTIGKVTGDISKFSIVNSQFDHFGLSVGIQLFHQLKDQSQALLCLFEEVANATMIQKTLHFFIIDLNTMNSTYLHSINNHLCRRIVNYTVVKNEYLVLQMDSGEEKSKSSTNNHVTMNNNASNRGTNKKHLYKEQRNKKNGWTFICVNLKATTAVEKRQNMVKHVYAVKGVAALVMNGTSIICANTKDSENKYHHVFQFGKSLMDRACLVLHVLNYDCGQVLENCNVAIEIDRNDVDIIEYYGKVGDKAILVGKVNSKIDKGKTKYRVFVSNFDFIFGKSIGYPDGKYILTNKIGSGATSTVYDAQLNQYIKDLVDTNVKDIDGNFVIKQQAININSTKGKKNGNTDNDIDIDIVIYKKLKHLRINGISCQMYDYFQLSNFKYFVFEKLGVSLQHLWSKSNTYSGNIRASTFTMNQVLSLFDQLIVSLFKLHSIGFVHNDIKLENILIGNKKDSLNKFYLIDFGIATAFWDFSKNQHCPLRVQSITDLDKTNDKTTYDKDLERQCQGSDEIKENKEDINQCKQVAFHGTFRFSSKNHHCLGLPQSRRDDLESLLYLCIFCLTGTLPWVVDTSYSNILSKQQLFERTQRLKQDASIDNVCKNVPNQCHQALSYVRKLKFDEMPDYVYLRDLFFKLYESIKAENISWNAYNGYSCSSSSCELHSFIGARIENFNIDGKNEDKKDLVTKENTRMIYSYNNTIDKLNNRTLTNYQTHMSIQGLRTRFGYLIQQLTIGKGVPYLQKNGSKPCLFSQDYAGIIMYKLANNNDFGANSKNNFNKKNDNKKIIIGEIFMLPVKICHKINAKYKKRYNMMLLGQIHGAIYYHYFNQNVHANGQDGKLEFIRGFSMFKNGKFSFRSATFNVTGYKLIDSKYKTLAKCEQSFVLYAIYNFWKQPQNTIYTFDQFIQTGNIASLANELQMNDNVAQYFENNRLPMDNVPLKYDSYTDTKLKTATDCQFIDQKVPQYDKIESKMKMRLNDDRYHMLVLSFNIICNILDFLDDLTKVKMYQVSHNSRCTINKYHFTIASSLHKFYLCKIVEEQTLIATNNRVQNLDEILLDRCGDDEIEDNCETMECNQDDYDDSEQNKHNCKLADFSILNNIDASGINTTAKYGYNYNYNLTVIELSKRQVEHYISNTKQTIDFNDLSLVGILSDANNNANNSNNNMTVNQDGKYFLLVNQYEKNDIFKEYCRGNNFGIYFSILKLYFITNIGASILDKKDKHNYKIVSFLGKESVDWDINCNGKYNDKVKWTWHRKDDIWYDFDDSTTRKIEHSFQNNAKSVTIKCQTCKLNISDYFEILFPRMNSDMLIQHDECKRMFDQLWDKGLSFTQYFYQRNKKTSFVRIVRRVDHSQKNRWMSNQGHTIWRNYF